jgi:hypothetical protein
MAIPPPRHGPAHRAQARNIFLTESAPIRTRTHNGPFSRCRIMRRTLPANLIFMTFRSRPVTTRRPRCSPTRVQLLSVPSLALRSLPNWRHPTRPSSLSQSLNPSRLDSSRDSWMRMKERPLSTVQQSSPLDRIKTTSRRGHRSKFPERFTVAV